jgi:hypothetical protein
MQVDGVAGSVPCRYCSPRHGRRSTRETMDDEAFDNMEGNICRAPPEPPGAQHLCAQQRVVHCRIVHYSGEQGLTRRLLFRST